MSEVQDTWKELGSKAEALGLKLKLHLEQEQDEATEREPGDTKATIEEMGKKFSEAFDSMGNAAKDEAVHEDIKEMGTIFKDALLATLNKVSSEVNARAGKSGSASDEGAESDDSTPPPPAIEDAAVGDESDGSDA